MRVRPKIRVLLMAAVLALSLPLFASASETLLGRATIEVNGKPLPVIRTSGHNIRRAALYDRYGRRIGRSHLVCVVITRYQRTCWGIYLLPKGNITVAGVIQAKNYMLAITGGTGLYANARGSGRVTPSGEAVVHRVFFQLVG